MIEFDDMLRHVGEFGLYQKILFIFQSPFCMYVTFVNFAQVFMVLYPTNYWCEHHFACISPNSVATAEQRRNISFEHVPGGLFSSDYCRVNNVNDSYLQELMRLENQENCRADRTQHCLIPRNGSRFGQRRRPSGSNSRSRRPWNEKPYLLEEGSENDTGNGGELRTKRQTTFRRNNWFKSSTPPPPNGGNGGYEDGRDSSRSSFQFTTTTERLFGRGRSSASAPGRRSEVTSAYAGWPTPRCERPRQQFNFILSNNTRIIRELLNLRHPRNKSYGRIEDCQVRWNMSALPYETIVTEGGWWCTAELYVTIAQIAFFLGAIVGGFGIGYVADNFGRVPALVIANIFGAVGGLLSISSTNVWAFSFFRFITGMAFDNCFTMIYILVLEFCGPTYRTLVANLSIAIWFTVGTTLIPVLAVVIADWRILSVVLSAPMFLGLVAWFVVPESARWLLSKGRSEEATTILRKFAKVNKKQVPDEVFVQFQKEAEELFRETEAQADNETMSQAFKLPRLRRTIILLTIYWSCLQLVYDGHSRNVINLANEDLNVFWLFGIASSTELPADLMLLFTLDVFGRRWLAFASIAASGICSIVAAAITPQNFTPFLVFAIIARFWANVSFNIGLQYVAELLPTTIRAQGLNYIHIAGYVASIISPFVAAVGRSNPALSLILLGAVAIFAGCVALLLVETLGEDLPNTLEEAEQFGKDQSFWNCPFCPNFFGREEDEDDFVEEISTDDLPIVRQRAFLGSLHGGELRSSVLSRSPSVLSRAGSFRSTRRSRSRNRSGRSGRKGIAMEPGIGGSERQLGGRNFYQEPNERTVLNNRRITS